MTARKVCLLVAATVSAVSCTAALSFAVAAADSRSRPTANPTSATGTGLTPGGVAVDSAGNVYIADYANSVVEKVAPSGTVSIVAGVPGQSGQPSAGPATSSHLGRPSSVAVDSSNNLYIADSGSNAVVEKVTPQGTLSIVAGIPGESGPVTAGPATSSDLDYPSGVTVDSAGNLFIADSLNSVVEKVTPQGTLSIIVGKSTIFGPPQPVVSTTPPFLPVPNSYVPALSSDLYNPSGVAVDASGNVFIADTNNNVVEQVTPGGALSIVAGIPDQSGTPDAGPASDSQLGDPTGLALRNNTLYIADPSNDVVEAVDLPTGVLSIVAGSGTAGTPSPGSATSSMLNDPSAVAVDSSGNLDIADFGNNLVERVTPGGTLSVLAGNGAPTVALVSPRSGPVAAGTNVTLVGSGFSGATSVNFGTNPGTNLTVNSAESITVTAPAGSGTVDVTVTTPQGTSATGSSDRFTYGSPQTNVTVTASNAASTYGAAPPTITPTYQGFIDGDTAAALTTAPTCSANVTSTTPAGTFASSCSGAAAANYTFTYVTGTVTIAKAAVNVSTKPVSLIAAASARQVNLTATVISKVTGGPVAGLTVGYAVTNVRGIVVYTCSAVTNPVGVATCSVAPVLGLALRLPTAYTATVNASANYLSGSAMSKIGP